MTAQGQRFPELYNEAWLRDAYETQGLSCPEIAAEVGCSQPAVGQALARHGIPSRRRS